MAYSTNWKITTSIIGVQPIADVSTTQLHPFGTIVEAVDTGTNQNGAGEFMYVKGVSSGATGAWVGVNSDDYTTTLATANGIYPIVGVMMSDLDAATDYGWVQISGKAVAKALTGFVDNANVYLTATAGSVDDAVVAGDRVQNVKGASALDGPATGMAEFELSRTPYTNDALAD
jgi:hypothetical protein